MYLKSLDVLGFKSFADKTRFEFHQGVTGIVGPNGCGKSNVVDAVRWVLGETSAKALRGGEMADVIFNGTERRKPLGMAEVTLTMADCEETLGLDYNEVALTRRVFRDGKSEYRINGTLCRLKDIQDLLMDTGIGRTAYSIMAQGQIDQILSSKPEERRAVFEEAAGITKYKREKKDALRKLEYTEANLLRVSDVIAEQERRMNSLKRQVSKARRYKRLDGQVRVLDTHLAHRRFVDFNAEAEELRTSIRSLEAAEAEHEKQMQPKEEAVAKAREEAREFENRMSELRQQLNDHRNALSSAEGRVAFNQERKTELEARITQNREEIQATSEKLKQQEFEFDEANETLDQIVKRIADMEQRFEEQEERTREAAEQRESVEQKLQVARQEVSQLQTTIASVQAKIESSEAQLERSRERARQLAGEEERLNAELEQARVRHDEIATKLAEQSALSGELDEAFQTAERQHQHSRGDLDAARQSAAEVHRTLATKSSRLEVLQQLVASGEGFAEGTRQVLDGLDDPETYRAGVRGVLAGLIEADAECARAIEAALGGHLQAVLVEDETLAEVLIGRLTEKKLGHAALLPANFIVPSNGTQMETLPDGAVAWALDKIKVDDSVRSVVEHLLDQVLVVPDLATALKLKSDHPGMVMVTLNGEWLGAEGVIRGGAAGDGQVSVLERQNEIRELEAEVESLGAQESAAKQRVAELETEVEKRIEEVETARDRRERHKVELSTLEGQKSLAQREVESVEGKLENVRWELGDLEEREKLARDGRSALDKDLAEAREKLEANETDQKRFEAELESARAEESDLEESLNEMRTALAVERRAQEAHKQQQQPMEARLAELREISQRRESEIQSFQERIDRAGEETESLQGEIETHRTQANEREAEIESRAGRREQLMSAIDAAETDLSEARKAHAKAAEQRGREEVAVTKVELRTENLENAIRERHDIDLATFEPDAHALLTCIDELKNGRGKGRTRVVSGESDEPGDGEDADELTADADDADDAPEVTVVEAVGEDVELPPEMEGEPDWEFVEACLSDLKRRLDSMGPVNLDAIEEFEELEERHNEVRRNYEDLVSSKTELLEVIERINVETERRFSETFAQVRINFQDMFKELFGEKGKADLALLDEGDPLESGIDVIAKPPGKKLQSIALLSGGERSMTAVALLFSIYMIKPSPFCVLDELDAPLDESNIGRFVKVLDRFVDTSQFIIVTHSKRTMSRADVMYGVTMEEFGVSKPVGMRLTEAGSIKPDEQAGKAETNAALKLDA